MESKMNNNPQSTNLNNGNKHSNSQKSFEYYVYKYENSFSSEKNTDNNKIHKKKKVTIVDNGKKDNYFKETLKENGSKKIIKEEGNSKLKNLNFPNLKFSRIELTNYIHNNYPEGYIIY